MLDWAFLLEQAGLAEVVPDEYRPFRRPIAAALALFLGQLAPTRQAALVAEQAALPQGASPEQRMALLARGCPSLHKLGQVLARDQRLSPELRKHLQELESLPPALPLEVVQTTLAEELGPLERHGLTLLPPALAEASVAVVIPFRDERGRDGVLKLLKPGVVERLEEELALFDRIGAYLDERCDEFQIPHLDYQEVFEQVRDKLQHEVRFDLEQRHLALARAAYLGDPRVLIPALLEPCTARVTAMERVWGGKVTDCARDGRHDPRRLADLVVEAVIGRPTFSHARRALFHADPHAGNLFLTRDGRLALLDWSLVGWLGEAERDAMVQVVLGALTQNADRILAALTGLAGPRIDRPALESLVCARLGKGGFPGFTWLLGLLDDAVGQARLRVGADLMLFRKALHTLEGVVHDIAGAAGRIDSAMLGQFLHLLAAEGPFRWLAPPHSRAFPTRLSNADLAGLMLSWPWAAARLWLDRAWPA